MATGIELRYWSRQFMRNIILNMTEIIIDMTATPLPGATRGCLDTTRVLYVRQIGTYLFTYTDSLKGINSYH